MICVMSHGIPLTVWRPSATAEFAYSLGNLGLGWAATWSLRLRQELRQKRSTQLNNFFCSQNRYQWRVNDFSDIHKRMTTTL